LAELPPLPGGSSVSLGDFIRPQSRTPFDRSRAISIAITTLAHVVIIAGLIFGIQTARTIVSPPPITVSLVKSKPVEIKPVAAAIPHMVNAPSITAPPPVFTVITPPSPIVAAPPAPPEPVAGPPAAPPSNGNGTIDPEYLKRIQQHLLLYFIYPRAAQDQRIQGVVLVHFISDRAGHILSYEISHSSGYAILDDEARDVMKRGGPLPPMPDDMGGDRLNAQIPMTFQMPDPVTSVSFGRFGR
jgi:protein TonB